MIKEYLKRLFVAMQPLSLENKNKTRFQCFVFNLSVIEMKEAENKATFEILLTIELWITWDDI